jgi:hypothetical protein
MKKSIVMLVFAPFFAIAQSDSDQRLIASANHPSTHATRSVVNYNKAEILTKYIGHYKSQLIKDLEFDLFLEGDKLYGLKKGESKKVEISMVSPSEFLVKGKPFQIQFMEDVRGVQFMMFAKDQITWLEKVK